MVELGERFSIEDELDESHFWSPVGEHPGMDLTDPFAKHTNRKLMAYGLDPNVVVPIPEFGEVAAKNVRVWRGKNPAELIAFIRQGAGEHKVITSTVLALGVVATAVSAVKYSKHK